MSANKFFKAMLRGHRERSKKPMPVEQGELIQLLRSKEAIVTTGRKIPLPPQGRMVYPKQTAKYTKRWVADA